MGRPSFVLAVGIFTRHPVCHLDYYPCRNDEAKSISDAKVSLLLFWMPNAPLTQSASSNFSMQTIASCFRSNSCLKTLLDCRLR